MSFTMACAASCTMKTDILSYTANPNLIKYSTYLLNVMPINCQWRTKWPLKLLDINHMVQVTLKCIDWQYDGYL